MVVKKKINKGKDIKKKGKGKGGDGARKLAYVNTHQKKEKVKGREGGDES